MLEKSTYKFIKIEKSKKPNKKYDAIFQNEKTGRKSRTSFGQKGAPDYLQHKDKARRDRYIQRHKKDLNTGDPRKAGYLSMYILWGNHTNLHSAVNDYRTRYNNYLKTGTFKKSITNSILK